MSELKTKMIGEYASSGFCQTTRSPPAVGVLEWVFGSCHTDKFVAVASPLAWIVTCYRMAAVSHWLGEIVREG